MREFSDEHRKKLSEANVRRWKDPKYRERVSQSIKDSYTPELREQRSQTTKEHWKNNPGRKVLLSMKMSNRNVNDETRKKISESRTSVVGHIKQQLLELNGRQCSRCGTSEEKLLNEGKRGLMIHHKNYERTIPEINDLELLCGSCHSTVHNELRKQNHERYRKVCRAVKSLLKSLELDLNDQNFIETPRRMATWLLDFTKKDEELSVAFEEFASAVFPFEGTDLVTAGWFRVYSVCPHHMLPVKYDVAIGYIPKGFTLGLSKLVRFAETVASRPVLQESYVGQLADVLVQYLSTPDVIVIVEGRHSCMEIRGVKTQGQVLTTALRGAFDTDTALRMEFYSMLKFMGDPRRD